MPKLENIKVIKHKWTNLLITYTKTWKHESYETQLYVLPNTQ
jgi:hypothetical protein